MGLEKLFSKFFSLPQPAGSPVASLDPWAQVERLARNHEFTVVDVGAQNLASEEHVYTPLCRPDIKHRIIGFEPLQERADERSASDGAQTIIYPVAIGDGATHTLYVNNDDATSSLFPLNEALCAEFEHLNTLKLASTERLATSRLDDVLPAEPVDFLKLDIQGAELLALENASKVLDRTAVIHCEVEFDQIYKGQPLFHDVSKLLADKNFYLVDLLIAHRYYYENSLNLRGRDRLLWADAIFFKSTDDKDAMAAQAVVAALVYGKPTLAQSFIDRLNG
ncbi:FkbM family methyltransferase [Methylocystis sp. JAN1]|uniref:FkbM family methyltransferase n=1 Tax=Methylocystis sp. JAN1 TaxID=3397211 RepID=UPI003FA301A9